MYQEMPLVSVVIPVYNVLPYLREALDSVVHQTYPNLEILIVDDGSTDGSAAVCDAYGTDSRVKVIHQENRGLSAARNAGLDLMTGDYVSFLDPDDAFHPEMVRCLLDTLISRDADMVTCGYDVFETEGSMRDARRTETVIPGGREVLSPEETLEAIAVGKYTICVWNKIYKRKIWAHLRFPEGRIYEDVLVAPDVVRQCERIAVVKQPLVYRRKREGSITRTMTVENIRQRMDAQAKLLKCLEALLPGKTEGYRESSERALFFMWAALKKSEPRDKRADDLKREILKHAGTGIRYRKLKSRAAWCLFRFCPRMLLPARKYFRKLKRLLGKERGVVA